VCPPGKGVETGPFQGGEDLIRQATGQDTTLLQIYHPICVGSGFHVLCGEKDMPEAHFCDGIPHPFLCSGIKMGVTLIQNQYLRFLDQGSSKGNQHFLPRRALPCPTGMKRVYPELVEHGRDPFPHFMAWNMLEPQRRGNLIRYGIKEESSLRVFIHPPDSCGAGQGAIDMKGSIFRFLHPGTEAQERAFPCTIGTNHRSGALGQDEIMDLQDPVPYSLQVDHPILFAMTYTAMPFRISPGRKIAIPNISADMRVMPVE
jgi:hypothetical protein